MQVPEGFTKQLIATEPQIMDPVAFCFDDKGNILVAESFRQEQGVEDNRSSSFWLNRDIGLQSVESRLRMYQYYADQRKNGILSYPNPCTGSFTVEIPAGISGETMADISYEVFDTLGKRVIYGTSPTKNIQINIDGMPPGIYSISVQAECNSSLYHFTSTIQKQ